MFIMSLLSHLIIFHSYGSVTIAGEGLQILTYAPLKVLRLRSPPYNIVCNF